MQIHLAIICLLEKKSKRMPARKKYKIEKKVLLGDYICAMNVHL